MNVRWEGNIFDQINMWMERADEMALMTHNLKSEISYAYGKSPAADAPGVCQILPLITIYKNNVYCNGVAIPLARMKTPLSLFRVFLRRPFKAFTRDQLLEKIYGDESPKLRTDRLTLAMHHNLIKLISRTRLIAEAAVNTGPVKWIEWFPYDAENNIWSFYRLTNAYLLEKQAHLQDAKR